MTARRLAVEVSGAGERLVLVHGFTQTARSWRRVISHLPAGHEIVAVDLPGHGASAQVRVADLDEQAALVGESAGRGSYVGYSLGGRTCLTLALSRPDLVERLVLVGATAGIEDEAAREQRRLADDGLAERLESAGDEGLAAFLASWLAGPLFADLSPEAADVDARLANTAAGLASSLRSVGTGTQRPSFQRLGELEMPVLLVVGERDERFLAIAEQMAEAIGGRARLAVIAGVGHAACFADPVAFGAAVAQFLC